MAITKEGTAPCVEKHQRRATMENPEEMEALLDRFPLQQSEIEYLLTLYPSYAELYPEDITNNTVECISRLERGDCGIGNEQLEALERDCIPELSRIFQYAMKTVIIIANNSDDATNGEPFNEKVRLLEACVSLLGRRGDRFLHETLFATVAGNSDVADAEKLMSLVYRMGQVCHQLRQPEGKRSAKLQPPASWAKFLTSKTMSKQTITLAEWKRWATMSAPNVHRVLSTVFHYYLLSPGFEFKPHPPFEMPLCELKDASSRLLQKLNGAISMQLGFMDLGGPVHRLYNSDENGLSFPTFMQSLIGFQGPTLILIETVQGEILGYFSEIPWKTSPSWFTGEGESFLFRLHPSWDVYYPVENGLPKKYHQYLHLPVSYRKDHLVGLAVGGVTANAPRLHIEKSLEKCKACSIGVTFESGSLLGSEDESFFDIDTIEVWAVRTPDVASYQKGVKDGELKLSVKEAVRSSCAQVDRAEFLDDFRSGTFMNTLFSHRQAARGRADFVAADAQGKGYYIEDKHPSNRYCTDDEDNEADSLEN